MANQATDGRITDNSVTDNSVIDLHAHVVLEDAFGMAGAVGPELTEVDGKQTFRVGEYTMSPAPYRGSVFMDLDRRLEGMDKLGIDQQLLSPNPLTLLGGVNAGDAARFAAAHNDAMVRAVAHAPDRFFGAAQVALQDIDAARAEAERAKGLGLHAVYVGSDYGVGFDDPALDPFYATMVDLDLPLFIHAVTNDGLIKAPDKRLHQFGLELVVGYTYEETITVASLVLGGVFDRHPNLDICISHGGGAIAYLVERFDSMSRFRREPEGFAEKMSHLWFDAHMEAGPSRQMLIDLVGTERMVFGTNFGGWDTPAKATAFDASLTPNACRLLRLDANTQQPGDPT